MMKRVLFSVCMLQVLAHPVHAQMVTLIDEDFEAGPGAWQSLAGPPRTIERAELRLFGPTDPLLYDNQGNPGTQSAGFTSNRPIIEPGTPAWVGRADWIEKRFVGVVPPGTYPVHLEMDVYAYKDGNYRLPLEPDPWALGNRLYLLTDGNFADPCLNYDGGLAAGIRRSYWNGDNGVCCAPNGVWRHVVAIDGASRTMTTTTGSFELRLLMHQKYGGAETIAWDNVLLRIGDFTFTEDFENGLDAWTVKSYEIDRPTNDMPTVFAADDPRLYANLGNTGSKSAGYSSEMPCVDNTPSAYLRRLFPGVVGPGLYEVAIEMDAYVYKNAADPQALGNRVLVLTDGAYDDPDFRPEADDPAPGFRLDTWLGDELVTTSGTWQHIDMYQDVATATGDIEIRLLMQETAAGPQAVAWDNVRVRIGQPCFAPRFDQDGDGDVDQEDFGTFQTCFTGTEAAGGIANFKVCRCMNADGDADIDRGDLEAFVRCAAGPAVPAVAGCESGLPRP